MSEERIKQYIGDYVDVMTVHAEMFLGITRSPIERLFLAASLAMQEAKDVPVPDDLVNAVGADTVRIRAPSTRMSIHSPMSGRVSPSLPLCGGLYGIASGDITSFVVAQYSLTVGGRDIVIDLAMIPAVGHATPPVAIELDGHDFHERTKEQAAKDKSRDRLLQAAGWKAFRFTGSEVYRDPLACVREVHESMFWEEARRNHVFAEMVKAKPKTAPRRPW